MYPRMFGGLDLKPECLQPLLFTCEIGESYLERDVVDGGRCRVCTVIIWVL